MNYETADLMMEKLCQLTCNALGIEEIAEN